MGGRIDRAMELVMSKPEFIEIIESILDLEEKRGWIGAAKDVEHSWEWHLAKVSPKNLNKLVEVGVLDVTYKSANSTMYRLTDPDEARRIVTLQNTPMEEIRQRVDPRRSPTLPEDIFSIIENMEGVLDITKASLLSDKPVHILLTGPPATGKSLILGEIARLPGARYVVGSAASKAGLTRYMIDHQPSILIIDELDKMDGKDQSALLSVMETGIVSEMKAGRTEEIVLHLKVYASANYPRRIARELRSRFAEFSIPEYTEEQMHRVITRALVLREGCSEMMAEVIATETIKRSWRDPRVAVRVARLARDEATVKRVFDAMDQYRGEE